MNKTSKTKTNRKNKSTSQKGKRNGQVGAPPKAVKWPTSKFTMQQLFDRHSKGNNQQCELTLRTKVADGLNDGSIVKLPARKQPKGAAGRPSAVFILKAHFTEDMAAPKTPKTPKVKATKKTKAPTAAVVVTQNVTPAVPPTPTPVVPHVTLDETPTPVNVEVREETAQVEQPVMAEAIAQNTAPIVLPLP